MEAAHYLAGIREVVAEQFAMSEPTLSNSDSLQSLGGDSLDAIEIVMQVEDFFGRELDEERFAETMTLLDFANAVAAQWDAPAKAATAVIAEGQK